MPPSERLRGDPTALRSTTPDAKRITSYGLRKDQTPKGPGFFGELTRTDEPEMFSTELSVSVGPEKQLIPLLVPSLTREEIAHLVDGGDVTEGIYRKALTHARQREAQGQSPFATIGEQTSLPDAISKIFDEGYRQ